MKMVNNKTVKAILKNYGLSVNDASTVLTAAQMLADDPDAAVIMLEDNAGIFIKYDDMETLCEYYCTDIPNI